MEVQIDIPKNMSDLSGMQPKGELITEQDQKRAAWLAQRLGKFTCSQFSRLMTYENDASKFPSGAETYVIECVTEELTGLPAKDDAHSKDIDWGVDHELEAIASFEEHTKVKVRLTGEDQEFVEYEEHAGGTPDGRIGDDCGIEVKCPKSTTHLKYIRSINCDEDLKKVNKDYYWQIVGSMLITGAIGWYFISYDPRMIDDRLKLHIVKITRNESEINKLRARLTAAMEHKEQMLFDMDQLIEMKSKTKV